MIHGNQLWGGPMGAGDSGEFDPGRLAAESLLLEADPTPAGELLQHWRFASDPRLLERFVNHVAAHPPAGPGCSVKRTGAALQQLQTLGQTIERCHRAPWADSAATPTARDSTVAALWRGWADGRPFDVLEPWEDLFLGPLSAGYLAVVNGAGASSAVREQVARELGEGSFWVLAGNGQGVPGWRKILARVVEAQTNGPFVPLFEALSALDRRRFTDGAAGRQYGRDTLALLFEEVSDTQLQADLAGDCYAAEGCEGPIDLHVALRLIDVWQEIEPGGDTDWNVITQNRGRIRTRLRALLAEGPLAQCWPLPESGLYAQTRSAVLRYGRAWAQSRRAYGFMPTTDEGVDAVCSVPPDPRPAVDEDARAALRCWVLAVALSGHVERLERWVMAGGTGDRDAAFYRWLNRTPPALLVAGRPGDNAGYRHLRATLGQDMDGWLRAIEAALARVAALELEGKGRGAAITAAIGDWHGDVHRPSGRKSNIQNARDALAWMRARRSP